MLRKDVEGDSHRFSGAYLAFPGPSQQCRFAVRLEGCTQWAFATTHASPTSTPFPEETEVFS